MTRAVIRSRPSTAPEVARLRYLTEDGPFEVYPILESQVDDARRTWLHIRVPMRPNGQTEHLGSLQYVTTMLRVNRATLRATLYRPSARRPGLIGFC